MNIKNLILSMAFFSGLCESKELTIYHDADYTNHSASATAMLMGMQTALSEVDHQIQGHQIKVISKNHRGNSKRSLRHMQQFLEDDSALFVLGGLHSPPYIQHRDFINENEILLLVAWAAGGPITRYAKGKNWVFRLSLDDLKAGHRLGQFALEERNCQSPHLLLEDTPWGRSNSNALLQYANSKGSSTWPVTWFGWNTGLNLARTLVRKIKSQGADCVIFVGNHLEGEQFAKAAASLGGSPPTFISHWGITGGDFQAKVNHETRENLELRFLQTCYSFLSPNQSPHAKAVFARAKALYPDKLRTPEDIPAPAGFIHAYDLGKLVIESMKTFKIQGSVQDVRQALHSALESLDRPVLGLVKTYHKPFSEWSPEHPDAHEALGVSDICMAHFNKDNHIILDEPR
jgi:branched-chain amino acid transport system substrate-binding protein